MNTIIKKLLLCFILLSFIACDENEAFKEELYKKVICVLSDDNKVFAIEHDLNQEESVGYISINSGGTNRISKDIRIEIEPDTKLLPEYNYSQYDTATLKYARELPSWRYEIPVMSTTLKANGENTYALVEIKVKPEGLSPDSLYMIPLRIKNVSEFEVNPDKDNVLYRVLIKNDYARQKVTTYYKMKGTKQIDDGTGSAGKTPTSSDKTFFPISKNKVRILAGTLAFKDKTPTLEEIDKSGIIVTINDDKTVTLSPAGSLQLEMVGGSEDNKYEEVDGAQIFNFSYKYYSSTDSKWIIMTEKCTRSK